MSQPTSSERHVPQANWVRFLNTIDRSVGASSLIPLDSAHLMQIACEQTGLSDFGDSAFQASLTVLLGSLREEASLTLVGRLLVACDVLRVLESRLRIIDTEKRHPAIADEQIRSPIFVLGMARTGTTILHQLLAQDPNNRAPLVWEMFNPAPPVPQGASREERLSVADAFMKLCNEIDSSYLAKHEERGDQTSECCLMMLHEFGGSNMFGGHEVPRFIALQGKTDPIAALRMHKRILQVLQWGREPKHWVLKDPTHLAYLPSLLSVYPDAKIVHTHRDPAQAMHSTTSLLASLRLMRSDQFDARAITVQMNIGQCMSLEKVIEERQSGAIPAKQIADVFFNEFLKDPVAQVERLYEHWGLELTVQAKSAMQAYMKSRPRTEHGRHEYAYADAVEIESDMKQFARYMDYYQIKREQDAT